MCTHIMEFHCHVHSQARRNVIQELINAQQKKGPYDWNILVIITFALICYDKYKFNDVVSCACMHVRLIAIGNHFIIISVAIN